METSSHQTLLCVRLQDPGLLWFPCTVSLLNYFFCFPAIWWRAQRQHAGCPHRGHLSAGQSSNLNQVPPTTAHVSHATITVRSLSCATAPPAVVEESLPGWEPAAPLLAVTGTAPEGNGLNCRKRLHRVFWGFVHCCLFALLYKYILVKNCLSFSHIFA